MTSPDFRDRLQSTLGAAYTLERELGGGGMSRVFLAEETALGRKVVIKVLPPELAATVNAERFRREIQLAAQLQHPHIVPLLAAGISDGLPYYTMPYVTGESLRARLSKAGELPIPETVRILRDVLTALSYAHEQGVVHRDIKPDNVLLTKHHAVVTDFGVAKAISAAAAKSEISVTSLGIALGTPAYMAPEQAAADPSTDHRADLYSVAAMGYEMLTGAKLFGDRSPQAMLAAHAIEQPDAIEKRRPTVPPALSALVMRALEKHPADRPQSADEMLAALDSVTTTSDAGRVAAAASASLDISSPMRSSGATRRRNLLIAATVLVLLSVAGIAVTMRDRPTGTPGVDRNLVVVVPFRIAGAEQSLSYLREGMLDLLAAKLTGEGGPRAADPRSVLAAWRRVAPSEREDLSENETVQLAANLGAGQVILGGIVGTPARMIVNATVLEVPSGKPIKRAVSVQGPADSLASLVDQLTVQLLSLQAGEDQQHLAELTSASLPAIRAYLDGKAAYRKGRYNAADDHFSRALQIDSTFALAAMGLIVSANWSASELIETGMRRAWQQRAKLSERDRLLLMAYAGPHYPVTPNQAEILAALDSAVTLAPDQPDLWYEYGDVLWHAGSGIGITDGVTRGRTAFARAYALDSAFAPAIEHLIDYAALAGDTSEVRRLTARYLALDSAADHAGYIRWRAAVALGDSSALRTIRNEMPRMDFANLGRIAGTAIIDGISIRDADAVADVLRNMPEHPRRQLDLQMEIAHNRGRLQRVRELEAVAMQIPANRAPAYASSIASTLYWGMPARYGDEAISSVRAFALSPLTSTPEAQSGQHFTACVAAVWLLSRGDHQGAREMLTPLRRTLPAVQAAGLVSNNSTCLEFVDAVTGMEANPSTAPAVLARLDSVSLLGHNDIFWPALNIELARLYEQRGNRQKALEVIRRRSYHWADGIQLLTTLLKEEGRLAAVTGDRRGAVKAFRHWMRLRGGADPALRLQLDTVRAYLVQLSGQ